MVNHSLDSCDSPLERSFQPGCPVSGPSLAGCKLARSEAPVSPLSRDTFPEDFRLRNVELQPDEGD